MMQRGPAASSLPMLPQAEFSADVVLVAPREMEVTPAQRTYREKSFTTFTERLAVRSFQQDYIRRINESLGLECLAAYLRAAGLRVAILNCNIAPHTTAELVEKIRTSDARVVGISLIYRPQVAQALSLLEGLAGVPEVRVCMGGALASFMPRELLRCLARLDAVVYGEAEETFRDYVCQVMGGGDGAHLPGIAFSSDGEVVINPAAPPLDLGQLLSPCRETLTYLEATGWPTRIASMFTSRGCFARCTFCTGKDAYNVERRPTYRFRDPVAVVDEMEYLKERFGVRFIYINDDNFLGYGKASFQRVRTIAEEILRRGLRLQFATECRVDALDADLLRLLKEAGMAQVLLGIESGSDAVLRRWRKGATAEENRNALALVQRLGVNVEPGYILIDAHTDESELAESLRFIEETGLHRTPFPTYLVNRLSVYPGTEIERLLVQDGTLAPSRLARAGTRLDEPGAIIAELRRLEYVCRDQRTEIIWRSLRYALEPVEQCLEDLLGRLTEALVDLRRSSAAPQRRARANDLLKHAASWRRRLGDLVLEFLRIAIASYGRTGHADQLRWLRRQLRRARGDYEQSTLGMSMASFVGEVLHLREEARAS